MAPETLASFIAEGGFVSGSDDSVWIGIGPAKLGLWAEEGKLSLYAPDFFLTEAHPWRIYEHFLKVSAPVLIEALASVAETPQVTGWQRSAFSDFESDFKAIQREIEAGNLLKAVPFIARRGHADLGPNQRAAILLSALRRCVGQPLQTYGFWSSVEGLVGTTPETLFVETANPRGLFTMALAGTRTPNTPSLLDDPKEVTEHRIVVEAIVERLSPLGTLTTGPTTELELPTLAHLITPIEVVPNHDVEFQEWVTALHPTPAIGAWPLEFGWDWLKNQPNAEDRNRYGAPFGFVPPDSQAGTCLVGIRNVQWNRNEIKVLAGCGIIAASQVEREWKELNAKLDSIQLALGLEVGTQSVVDR
jgi:menaquinone-specific isochorismate synthase